MRLGSVCCAGSGLVLSAKLTALCRSVQGYAQHACMLCTAVQQPHQLTAMAVLPCVCAQLSPLGSKISTINYMVLSGRDEALRMRASCLSMCAPWIQRARLLIYAVDVPLQETRKGVLRACLTALSRLPGRKARWPFIKGSPQILQ